LDLGCGDGILGKSIYQYYPGAQGVFLDISETMLRSAQMNLQEYLEASTFILKDMGQSSWRDPFDSSLSFDVIVSGFAIHHQPDMRKKEL
jgi:16S rRNA G1207 methylase RsmC